MISGKSKEMCVAALKAANGNPDVAFEILMSGIPLGGGAGEGDEGMDEGGDDYGDDDEGSEPMAGNPFAALA
jgi:hypothetical protein